MAGISHRQNIALSLLVAIITFLCFARLIECDFTTWDDPETIAGNPRLHQPSLKSVAYYWTTAGQDAPMGLYVPATYTLWIAIAATAGLNPHAFHAVNVILHAGTAVLVFQLLRRLLAGSPGEMTCGPSPSSGTPGEGWGGGPSSPHFGSDPHPNPPPEYRRRGQENFAALIGALLFAVHPVQVEPVSWASGTKDVLCGFFAVAALLQYVNFARSSASRPRRFHFAIATLCFVLAMLAKPTVVVLPLMAMTMDHFLLGRSWRTVLLSLWPWLLLSIPCAIITKLSQSAPWSTPLASWTRPAIAADAIAFYLGKLVMPLRLTVDYGRRPETVDANGWIYWTWIFPAALAAFIILYRRRWVLGVAGALLFLLPLLPVLGLWPFMFQYVSTTADHYLYLAMLGPALLAAWAVQRWSRAIPFATILILVLAVRSMAQEPVWQNSRALFEHALDVNPRSFVACDQLGFYHGELARKLRSSSPTAALGEFSRAADYYERGLAIHPQFVPSIYNLAIVYREIGRDEDARAALRHIVELQQSLPPGLQADPIGLAEKLLSFDDPSTAVAWLEQVLQADPSNERAANLRQLARARIGPTSRPVTTPIN